MPSHSRRTNDSWRQRLSTASSSTRNSTSNGGSLGSKQTSTNSSTNSSGKRDFIKRNKNLIKSKQHQTQQRQHVICYKASSDAPSSAGGRKSAKKSATSLSSPEATTVYNLQRRQAGSATSPGGGSNSDSELLRGMIKGMKSTKRKGPSRLKQLTAATVASYNRTFPLVRDDSARADDTRTVKNGSAAANIDTVAAIGSSMAPSNGNTAVTTFRSRLNDILARSGHQVNTSGTLQVQQQPPAFLQPLDLRTISYHDSYLTTPVGSLSSQLPMAAQQSKLHLYDVNSVSLPTGASPTSAPPAALAAAAGVTSSAVRESIKMVMPTTTARRHLRAKSEPETTGTGSNSFQARTGGRSRKALASAAAHRKKNGKRRLPRASSLTKSSLFIKSAASKNSNNNNHKVAAAVVTSNPRTAASAASLSLDFI